MSYNLINGQDDQLRSIANGLLEPNTQELICSFSKAELNDWERVRVQAIAFKKDKTFIPQPVLDETVRINSVKFYKLHSFTENDYFDEPAMVFDLLSSKEQKQLLEVSPEEIKAALYSKESPEPKKKFALPLKKQSQILEVDLHINELLETTSGLSNADMLRYQLDKFKEIMDVNQNKRGQKIVFIHGKGDGVLRAEIEKLLKTVYKKYYFQDASFREYGFGATMVTIK